MGHVAMVVIALGLGGCKYEAPGSGDDMNAIGTDASAGEACGEVPVDGVCVDAQLQRCVDGVLETEACEMGCAIAGGVAACNVLDCSTVGPLGRCDGETLARCDHTPALTDCARDGQTCAYVDDTTGYGCVDPASLASRRVTGTIRWQDRPISPGQLAPAVTMPARGVMVSVLDNATNTTLATVSTADDGSYVAHYNAPVNSNVRIATYSRSRSPARPARVRDSSGYLHALGGTAFPAGDPAPADLTVLASSSIGGAWNALDNAITAMDWLRARGVETLSPVYMYWQLGVSTGSYYQGGNNSLHLDGDDGWDDVVALHELGHYVQDEYSASDNPGGAHDGTPADPRLAWGEGGATWFAIAVRGVPYYIDYSAGGGWAVELEDRVHKASATGAMSQRVSEWMVAELLWDVGDGSGGGDNDSMNASHEGVWDVFAGYVVAPHIFRGFSGVDLVEFLDGWFMHHGMGHCGEMHDLVVGHYGFPYDFAGPAGACP